MGSRWLRITYRIRKLVCEFNLKITEFLHILESSQWFYWKLESLWSFLVCHVCTNVNLFALFLLNPVNVWLSSSNVMDSNVIVFIFFELQITWNCRFDIYMRWIRIFLVFFKLFLFWNLVNRFNCYCFECLIEWKRPQSDNNINPQMPKMFECDL